MLRSRENAGHLWSRNLIGRYALLAVASLAAFMGQSSYVRCEESAAASTAKVASSAESRRTLQSGPEAGSTIHQFFVRAVTGPHRNRSVCYVCRYGNRPVVMVLIQQSDPNLAVMLKAIDAIVDDNRVSGLRSFGVLVTDDSARAVPILQTMAFDEQIRMPLTAATTAIAGPGCHNLHEDAATTVILYRGQQAVENFAFAKGEINERSILPLMESVGELIAPEQSD
ncbi:MAG: hypothetical protein HQ518_05030 [Rhodopirellula sp.]|nr:hypothetical protein [Rhodopirellula sp.]